MFFLYKHTEPDFWCKIKHNASLNLRYKLKFFFDLINPLSAVKLYAYIIKTNVIFSLLTKLTNQQIKITKKRFTIFSHKMELNFSIPVVRDLETLSIM